MDRPGVRQVQRAVENRVKMEKTGCKIICGTPTTLAVKGLMMMIKTTEVTYNNGHFWRPISGEPKTLTKTSKD